MTLPSIAVAAAVNSRAILHRCLTRSPDIVSERVELRTYEGYSSASAAYNAALDECGADILVFAHQDVFLPEGFIDRLHKGLIALDRLDPDWAVAGVVGADPAGRVMGRVWSSGHRAIIGGSMPLPTKVETLDEMVVILRVDSGLRFDEELPGFHVYAADIIQAAASVGRSTWVIDAPAVHHSRPVRSLSGAYEEAWLYLRKKWWERLPIMNLVCPLTRSRWTLRKKKIAVRLLYHSRLQRALPEADPVVIAERLGFSRSGDTPADKHDLCGEQVAEAPQRRRIDEPRQR